MKVVLDTNVFVSGIFFGGPPQKVLEAWRDGKIQLLLSPAILEEYQRVLRELAFQFPEIKLEALIDFMIVHSQIILPPSLPPVIQEDPSDDNVVMEQVDRIMEGADTSAELEVIKYAA